MTTRPARTVLCFDDSDALCEEAAQRFARACKEAVARSGTFRVALSGGSTPRRLHVRLTQPPYRNTIAWDRIDFFWGDERSVPHDHPDSNFRMARETLLDPLGIEAARIHPMPADRDDLEAAALAYEDELAAVFQIEGRTRRPRFDLILLGMGDDAHTASLFPETPALAERHRWVVANPVPKLETTRMTFTLPLLNEAAQLIFLIAGANKAVALRDVLEGPADPEHHPSQAVAPVNGSLCLLLDTAAAARLDPATIDDPRRSHRDDDPSILVP